LADLAEDDDDDDDDAFFPRASGCASPSAARRLPE